MIRQRGFTLIELLVVISIIALLIAILLPALSEARKSAQSVQCASNIRQIVLAFNAYSVDNDGYYPPFNVTDNTYNFTWWTNLIVDGGYIHAPWKNRGWGKVDTGVFDCPAVPQALYDAGDDYPAYGVNTTRNQPMDRHLFGYQNKCVRQSELRRPTQLLMLGDAERGTAGINNGVTTSFAIIWPGNNGENWGPGKTQGRVSPRHKHDANLAFFDGHVRLTDYETAKANTNDMFGVQAW